MKYYKIKPLTWLDNSSIGMTHTYHYRPEHDRYRLTIINKINPTARNILMDFDSINEIKEFTNKHHILNSSYFLEKVNEPTATTA